MKNATLIVLVGVTAALWPAAGSGQMPPIPPGRWWERPRVVEELALTPEQRARLEETSIAHARQLVDLKAAVEKAEIDLRVAADQEPFEVAAVRRAFAALQQARSRLEAQRFEMLLEVRQVLSTAQWERLKELTREWARETERGKEIRDRIGPRPMRPRL